MHACRNKSTRIVNLLLKERELDLSAQDNSGDSVLIHAVRTGEAAIFDAILKEFVKRRIRSHDQANNIGETPLIVAAKLGYQEFMEKLLKKGNCSPKARDFELMLTAEEWSLRDARNSLWEKCFTTDKNSPQSQQSLNAKTELYKSTDDINNFLSTIGINKKEIGRQKVNRVKKGMKSQTMSTKSKALTLKESDRNAKQRTFYVHNINGSSKISPSQEISSSPAKLLRMKNKKFPSIAHVAARHSVNRTVNVSALSHHVGNDIRGRKNTSVKARLPEFYSILQEQKTHSYRLKASPPKSAEQLPRSSLRSEVLRRFAKAGFASIALNKLAFGRKSRGSADSIRFRPSTPSPVSYSVLLNYRAQVDTQKWINAGQNVRRNKLYSQ